MKWLINKVISRLQTMNLICEDEVPVCKYGLECVILKVIHIAAYFAICILLREPWTFFISTMALIILRTKAGGFHAKTRWGCFIFSCSTIALMCLINRFFPRIGISSLGVLLADIMTILFAPSEDKNRPLDENEKLRFRKQALIIASVFTLLFVTGLCFEVTYHYALRLGTGLLSAGVLIALKAVRKENP